MSSVETKIKIIQEVAISSNISKKLQELCISSSTYYRWKLRYEKYGKSGLDEKSRKPKKSSNRITDRLRTRIIRCVTTDRFENVTQIHSYLISKGESICLKSVINVLKRHKPPLYGLVEYHKPHPDIQNGFLISARNGLANNGNRLINIVNND
jgi:hypothetical protein